MITDVDEQSYPPASILAVDDNAANLLALTATLERLGHRVVTVSSGQDALRCADQEKFAVILIDVEMPGLDGFQTVTLLHEHPNARHTPVVFLSAHHQDMVAAQKGYAVG